VAYLIYLGVRAILGTWRRDHPPTDTCARRRLTSPYGQGILSNLAKPEDGRLLPQPAPPVRRAWFAGDAARRRAPVLTLTFGWLTAYAVVVARLGERLRAGRVRNAVDRISGVVLVALGLRLATERL
jgi:threonine/homoserine/homoserine lactone efflux protein